MDWKPGDWPAGEGPEDGRTATEEADTQIIQAVASLVEAALRDEASDIHLEPQEWGGAIRYRIDGHLHEVERVSADRLLRMVSRLKILARLDIAEKRLPQDGHLRLAVAGRKVDFRLGTLPTLHGEKAMLRILDTEAALHRALDTLGYESEQLDEMMRAIQRPHGMILVTGPTGSGKTVSLYACLNRLNRPDLNLCTVEDPVEIMLPGLNQVSLNERAGLDFSTALRAFLRQDPDILMVGEIRDAETADIAVKAAQTGHLLLSTLHTNDAPATLERLVRMGVPLYNIASSVILISAQRLVRRLCPHCRTPHARDTAALRAAGFAAGEIAADWTEYGPTGCPQCRGTGYRGRIGIFQVMPITGAIRALILDGAPASAIADQAGREGRLTLRQAGLRKVRAGLTSLAEVSAATHDD